MGNGIFGSYNSNGTSAIDPFSVEADRQRRMAQEFWNDQMRRGVLYPIPQLAEPERRPDNRAKLLLLCEEV